MTKNLVAVAVIVYCLVSSLTLFQSWQSSPFERLSALAFLLWLSPLLIKREKTPSLFFLYSGLFITLLGSLGSLNTLKYLGLALSIASFAPWGVGMAIWLFSAIAWMPVFGWIGTHLFPSFILPLKLGWVLFSSAALSLQNGITK